MNKDENLNLKEGLLFTFDDLDNQIELKCSPYSGLEEVFVNGELVTSKRSYSKNSTVNFDIGKNAYTLNLKTDSLLKGPITCTLSRNGTPQKKKQIVIIPPEIETVPSEKVALKKSSYKEYVLYFILGILFVIVKIQWELPFVSFFYFIGAVFIFVLIIESRKHYKKPDDPRVIMKDVEIK